jgi:hypothetical protein
LGIRYHTQPDDVVPTAWHPLIKRARPDDISAITEVEMHGIDMAAVLVGIKRSKKVELLDKPAFASGGDVSYRLSNHATFLYLVLYDS